MAYVNGYGQMCDGQPPSYDDTNGQVWDPEPYPPTPHRPPRLHARNVRHDLQRVPRGYWATKEGALLRIRAMSDRHLDNAMNYMERHARNRAWLESMSITRYIMNAPDGAADAAEEAYRQLTDMAHNKETDLAELAELVWPKYSELKREKEIRAKATRDRT